MKQHLSTLRMAAACVLCLLLCLCCTAALADSEKSFKQSCWLKTGSSAALYQLKDPDGGLTVGGNGSIDEDFIVVGSLAAGTYVKINTTLSAYGLEKVTYWSGGTKTGYVLSSALVSAKGVVHLDDGNSVEVPEAMLGDTAAIVRYLNNSYSNAKFSAIEGSSVIHVEYQEGAKVEWKPVETERLDFTFSIDPEKPGDPVVIKHLGTAYSTITVQKDTMIVPTVFLHWDTKMDENQQLAVVTAPKNGQAAMHLKSSSKSTVVTRLKQGRIVAVISTGKNYTKVWCDGFVGYVSTNALRFVPHVDVGSETQVAYITFRGKIKSNNEINVRAAASSSSRMLGTFRAGTQCTLFTIDGDWAEIELNGIHCFVLTKYLTTAQELAEQ